MKFAYILLVLLFFSCKSTYLYDENNKIEALIKLNGHTLEIAHLGTLDIPDSLFKHKNIRRIFLTNSDCLDSYLLFESLSNFKELEELYINSCNIKIIPSNIDKLVSLKIIRISNDKLYSISNNIQHTNIKSLILENTSIGKLNSKDQTKIFKSIVAIPTLNELSIYNNQIEILPEELSRCKITKLDIGKNNFKTVPSVLISMINNHNLAYVMIDYSSDLFLPNSMLFSIVKKERKTYNFGVYFAKEFTNDFTIDIISKLENQYPAVEVWGRYTLR